MHYIELSRWNPGLRKVSLTKLLQERAHLSLGEAKDKVDRLLIGEQVLIEVPTESAAEQLIREAAELGAMAQVRADLTASAAIERRPE